LRLEDLIVRGYSGRGNTMGGRIAGHKLSASRCPWLSFP
jgi:hypothetical protein